MNSVNPKDVALVNEHLVQCLRDSVMVFNQTQLVHWGLMGSKFYQIHLLTGDIQTEMVEGIDNIAEHVRSVNVMTPVSVGLQKYYEYVIENMGVMREKISEPTDKELKVIEREEKSIEDIADEIEEMSAILEKSKNTIH